MVPWCYGLACRLITGILSSIPPCVTIKTPPVRKTTGNGLIKSTCREKLRALTMVSATLEIKYSKQFFKNTTSDCIQSHYIILHHTSYHITLHYTTSHHITLRYIILHYIILHSLTLYYITPHIILPYIILHHTSYYINLHYTTSHLISVFPSNVL